MEETFSVKEIGRKSLFGLALGLAGIWVPILIANYTEKVSLGAAARLTMLNYFVLFALTGSAAGLIYRSAKALLKGLWLSIIAISVIEILRLLKIGGQTGYILHLVSFYLLPGFILGFAISWEGRKVKLIMSSTGGAIAQFVTFILTISLDDFLYRLSYMMPSLSWIYNAQIIPYLLLGALIWFFIGLAEETYKVRLKPKPS